jgi:hypothetical protein
MLISNKEMIVFKMVQGEWSNTPAWVSQYKTA